MVNKLEELAKTGKIEEKLKTIDYKKTYTEENIPKIPDHCLSCDTGCDISCECYDCYNR